MTPPAGGCMPPPAVDTVRDGLMFQISSFTVRKIQEIEDSTRSPCEPVVAGRCSEEVNRSPGRFSGGFFFRTASCIGVRHYGYPHSHHAEASQLHRGGLPDSHRSSGDFALLMPFAGPEGKGGSSAGVRRLRCPACCRIEARGVRRTRGTAFRRMGNPVCSTTLSIESA